MAAALSEAFPDAEMEDASDPLEAKALCEARSYDCVLMDYDMPGMNGLMLAQALKAMHCYLPTVLMTSFGDEMLAAEALRNGVSDYIPKSRITPDSIERAVTRAIHASSQARLIDEQREDLQNFAYALAHDFKQPIRQITTFSDLVREGLAENQDEELRGHLKFLGDAAVRLARLVDVMSQYTLLNRAPTLLDIRLEDVLDDLRLTLAPYLAERGGEIVIPEQLPVILGDEALMTQVFQNLIVNGLHYNKSKSPRVELIVKQQDRGWTIAVKDNGIGIEQRFVTEIFDPLIRLHTAKEYSGTGLGLTLARKAIHAQKGTIWCESEPGKGSTFFVRAPAGVAERVRRSRPEPTAQALASSGA
ncbi:MAG TPA: ATP-binding protein [Caulobacteraceae bacterium]|nr:ATP-binding protein [Caulobacteraceae bacterium]